MSCRPHLTLHYNFIAQQSEMNNINNCILPKAPTNKSEWKKNKKNTNIYYTLIFVMPSMPVTSWTMQPIYTN